MSDRLKSGIYDKVIIEPVDFYPSEVTSAQVTSKLLREVKAYIDKKLVDAIALSFEVVEKPQAGTMRVTPRISAIKTSTGDVEFKEMIPIGSVIALGKAAAGYRHQNIEIYMEFKATDSIDGEFIGGTVKQGKGAEISGSNEIVTLDHVKPLLEIWIEDVKDAFEKLQALRKLESQ